MNTEQETELRQKALQTTPRDFCWLRAVPGTTRSSPNTLTPPRCRRELCLAEGSRRESDSGKLIPNAGTK